MYINWNFLQINLKKVDLNIHKKSFFGQSETQYLGFGVTHDGDKSIDRKRCNKKY